MNSETVTVQVLTQLVPPLRCDGDRRFPPRANLTQEQLANRLGWHRTRIAKIEAGERRIDVPEFITVANGLNIDPVTLLVRVLRWL